MRALTGEECACGGLFNGCKNSRGTADHINSMISHVNSGRSRQMKQQNLLIATFAVSIFSVLFFSIFEEAQLFMHLIFIKFLV